MLYTDSSINEINVQNIWKVASRKVLVGSHAGRSMLYTFQVVSCHQLLLARIGTSYLCILICEFDALLVDEGSLNHFPKHLIGLSTIDRTSFL